MSGTYVWGTPRPAFAQLGDTIPAHSEVSVAYAQTDQTDTRSLVINGVPVLTQTVVHSPVMEGTPEAVLISMVDDRHPLVTIAEGTREHVSRVWDAITWPIVDAINARRPA